MKGFKEFVKDINEGVLNSRVETMEKAASYAYVYKIPSNAETLGWFKNKYNVGGWVITKLNDYDSKWVKEQGYNTNGIFRTFSDSGNTNLVKINIKTGTYAFADEKWEIDNDELKFASMSKFTLLRLEQNKEKEFGV